MYLVLRTRVQTRRNVGLGNFRTLYFRHVKTQNVHLPVQTH